jgi:hypothetical protein
VEEKLLFLHLENSTILTIYEKLIIHLESWTLVNSHHIVPGLGKITTQMKFTLTRRFLGGDKMLRGRVYS